MFPPTPLQPSVPASRLPAQARLDEPRSADPPQAVYGRPFWMTYAANLVVVIGTALLFHYADFITMLGGTEFHLGWIVGVGMFGSLFARFALGSYIDRYGCKVVWLGSTLVFSAICFSHLAITSHTGVAVYVLRVLYCCALAGIGGASMTFISKRSPNQHIAESVGMLGTSGFIGIILGSLLGDFLLGSVSVDRGHVVLMFVVAGCCALFSTPLVWLATRNESAPKIAYDASILHILQKHHSFPLLLVGMSMGVGLGLPTVFLRTYATTLGIPRIGIFFMVYSATAVITRLLTRRLFERFGNRPIILLGSAMLAMDILLFLLVRSEWQLCLPAIGFGATHAIMFPALMAAGNVTFPVRYRGLATLLILAVWDVGLLVGAPLTGGVLRLCRHLELPPYPTMFFTTAGLIALVGVVYWRTSRPKQAVGICLSGEMAIPASAAAAMRVDGPDAHITHPPKVPAGSGILQKKSPHETPSILPTVPPIEPTIVPHSKCRA